MKREYPEKQHKNEDTSAKLNIRSMNVIITQEAAKEHVEKKC